VGPAQCGVLVVEDDPDLQWQLARMLTIEGNRVVGTSSGDGALALIGEWPVDLVLVDEDLPKMTGLEVVRRIKRAHPNVPVVLMTGDETPEMSAAARLAGVVGCLIKPFQLETLTSLLTELAFGDALADPAE
jgi:CheY-like chemotaxis protein